MFVTYRWHAQHFYVHSVDWIQVLITCKAITLPNEPYAPPLSALFIFFVWVWFVPLFIYYYYCVYMVFRGSAWTCHSAHVEVKGQFHGVGSLLSFHRFRGLNWRCQVSLTKQFYVPSHLAIPLFWFCFKTRSHTVWASLELAIFSWEYLELLLLLPLPSIRIVDVCYHNKVCFYFLFHFILFLRQSLAI